MSLRKTMNDKVKNDIKKVLTRSNHVAIFSHIHPDGDAIGAQLALADTLKQQGIQVDTYNMSEKPHMFDFLKDLDDLKFFDEACDELPPVTICVDCGSLARTGLMQHSFDDTLLISIDHHKGNELFGQINWVEDTYPATCQMIAEFIKENNWPISKESATALFTGLSTDTGSFKYEQVDADTFITAAWLIQHGADLQSVRINVYESQSKNRFLLIRELLNQVEFKHGGLLAIACLTHEQLTRFNVRDDEVHGLVELLKNIEGVEVSVLFRTLSNGQVKISMRSKTYIDLNKVAEELGGGGHVRAAGVTMKNDLETAKEQTLSILSLEFERGSI